MKVVRSSPLAGFPDDVGKLKERIWQIIAEGRTILGEEVRRFEAAFADYIGATSCCGVNSGLDALILALKALGIDAGDQVVTQANTFHATVLAICAVGATPVLVDADPETFQIALDPLRAAVTDRTRAVLPVHLYGAPAPMEEIGDLANPAGLFVIEDAAQAHGARYRGQRVGSFGELSCFSFHPSKNLAAAGDAGAVCTSDVRLADRLRMLRWMGQTEQNEHLHLGLNSKLDALQAAILAAKLPQLDAANARRRELASLYRERLCGLPLAFQSTDDRDEPVFHLMQIRTTERDGLLAFLVERGIDAVVRYPVPIHLQPAFAGCGWRAGQFPVAEALSRELLCLPLRADLRLDELDYVCGAVGEYFGARASKAAPDHALACGADAARSVPSRGAEGPASAPSARTPC